MTEKRYFKRMWEEEYYIFDSNTISESDFEEKLEYQGYKAFEDCMMGDEVVNRLNELNNKCEFFEVENESLDDDITYYTELYNKSLKENEQLKQRCEKLRSNLIDHSALIDMLETVKALDIEDMIWNTMGYKTQTEFSNDFAHYREKAKKKWKE